MLALKNNIWIKMYFGKLETRHPKSVTIKTSLVKIILATSLSFEIKTENHMHHSSLSWSSLHLTDYFSLPSWLIFQQRMYKPNICTSITLENVKQVNLYLRRKYTPKCLCWLPLLAFTTGLLLLLKFQLRFVNFIETTWCSY